MVTPLRSCAWWVVASLDGRAIMPRIAQETVEQVAAASDIVAVIGRYFPLRRAGTNSERFVRFTRKKPHRFTSIHPSNRTTVTDAEPEARYFNS